MNILLILILISFAAPFFIMETIICSSSIRNKTAGIIGTLLNIIFSAVLFAFVIKQAFAGNLISLKQHIFNFSPIYQDFVPLIYALVNYLMIYAAVSTAALFIADRFVRNFNVKFKTAIIGLSSWVFVLIAAYIGYPGILEKEKPISIIEVCRKTTITSLQNMKLGEDDEYGNIDTNDAGYVIVKNTGSIPYESDAVYFSNDKNKLEKIKVNIGVLEPGETCQQWFTYNDYIKLKKNGITGVYLSDSGAIIDKRGIPHIEENQRYYLAEDGRWNVESLAKYDGGKSLFPQLAFSRDSGFYDDEFDLELNTENGLTIRYTLDGSIPTEKSSIYTEPIHVYDRSAEDNKFVSMPNIQEDYFNRPAMVTEPVEKAFVVRAAVFDSDGAAGEVMTKTYFIGKNIPDDKMVVSLVADPEDLFGGNGIHVTGAEYDEWYNEHRDEVMALSKIESFMNVDENGERIQSVWDSEPVPNYMREDDERLGNIEVFSGEKEILNQIAGVSISGNSSRALPYKRLSVFARKNYTGSKTFKSPIFGNVKSHALWLRYGFMNSFVPVLVSDRDVSVLKSVPVKYYLNGEYWYDTYLCEKYNTTYFSENYGLDPDNITYLKIPGESSLTDEEKELYSQEVTQRLNTYDFSKSEDYEQFCRFFDIQSFIDYTCINVFIDNEDTDDMLNTLIWKANAKENKSFGDGRWHWGLFDLDLQAGGVKEIQGVENNYEVNNFSYGRDGRALNEQPLFSSLKKNADFRKQFVIIFMDLMNANFEPDSVIEKLKGWDLTYSEIPYSDLEAFFRNRGGCIRNILAEEFGLSGKLGTVRIESNRAGTPVCLNTITPQIPENGLSWTGAYFTDYPVIVSANENGFDHWEVSAENGTLMTYTDSTFEVPVSDNETVIRAIYKN